MDLWQVRNQAVASLSTDLRQQNKALERCFALFDECIERFFSLAKSGGANERFALVCGHTLIKARRLALGGFSLSLDGLAFEGGALARSLLEAWQLLIYFQQDTSRIELVLSNNPPTAGAVAQAINVELQNNLKGLRDHYNKYTSHISFREEALMFIKTVYDREQLKESMRGLFAMILSISIDTLPCLEIIGKKDQALIISLRDCQRYGFQAFGVEV